MNGEELETEIRKALDAKAYEVDVPEGLAERTMKMAAGRPSASLRDRWSAWRDARRMHLPVAGYPRWMYAGASLGVALLLLVLGALVTDQVHLPLSGGPKKVGSSRDLYSSATSRPSVDARKRSNSVDSDASSGDAVAGQVTGTVSSGNSSTFARLSAGPSLEPQLVRSADIRVAVKNFDDAWPDANDIASKYDGAVIGLNTKQIGSKKAEGTVTMRIPSPKLDAAIKDLRGLGTLASLDTTGDDIAKQLDAAKSKVSDAKAEEDKLGALENDARTVSERLDVQRRLDDARKNTDSLKKKQKMLEDQVDFAIVNATIYQSASAKNDDSMLGKATNTAGRVGLTVIAGILVLLAALLPLAALAFAGWLAVRAIRRRTAS